MIHNTRQYQGWVHCDSRTTKNNEWKVRKFCMPLVARSYFLSNSVQPISRSCTLDSGFLCVFFLFFFIFVTLVTFTLCACRMGLVTCKNVAQNTRKAIINNHKIYIFYPSLFACLRQCVCCVLLSKMFIKASKIEQNSKTE